MKKNYVSFEFSNMLNVWPISEKLIRLATEPTSMAVLLVVIIKMFQITVSKKFTNAFLKHFFDREGGGSKIKYFASCKLLLATVTQKFSWVKIGTILTSVCHDLNR